jgi:pyruvate dehydrogenase E2 component (dihydrolipoyllysine-residue acetyltransferase)
LARFAVEIPKIGLVMETVRITRWLKGVGEDVQSGEPLLEVETEKAVVEIEAPISGRLEQVLVPVNQEAKVGDRIAWVETGEATSTSAPRPEPGQAGGRIHSSPLARRVAGEHGLDLRTITGSGPGGRVQLADVMQNVGGESAATASDVPGRAGTRLSPMQQALARAMNLSNATVPQFTLERGVDCTVLQALRADFNASSPPDSPKLSLNDFLLQAVARTLVEIPAMNATFSGGGDLSDARIVPASGAHIGLVVAIEGGLLVPAIHGAERYGLMVLALRRHDCVGRARAGRLKREELEGATISISNLGAGGPDRFAAMLNPPESAILAVGRQRDCVVAKEGAAAVRALVELTLTVDHRVANARLAAEFLERLVEILEGRDWRV